MFNLCCLLSVIWFVPIQSVIPMILLWKHDPNSIPCQPKNMNEIYKKIPRCCSLSMKKKQIEESNLPLEFQILVQEHSLIAWGQYHHPKILIKCIKKCNIILKAQREKLIQTLSMTKQCIKNYWTYVDLQSECKKFHLVYNGNIPMSKVLYVFRNHDQVLCMLRSLWPAH